MIVAAYLSLLAYGLLDNLRGPFFSSQINEFNLNETQGALIFVVASAVASLAAWAGNPLLGRWGVARLLQRSSLMLGTGYILMGLAPGFLALIAGAMVFGLGLGWGTLAQNVAVSACAAPLRRSALLSGLHAMYGVASTISPGLAAYFLGAHFNWRQSYMLIGMVPLLLMMGTHLWLRFHGSIHVRPLTSTEVKSPRPTGLTRVHIWLTAFLLSSYLWAEISVGTRLVRFLELSQSMTAETGSLFLSGFFGGLCVARLLAWAWAPQKLGALRWSLIGLALAGLAGLSFTLAGQPWAIGWTGLVLGPFYPLGLAYLHQRFGEFFPRALAATLGMGSLMILILHFTIGLASDRWGLPWAMAIGPLGLALTVGLLLVERHMPDPRASQTA